MQRDMFHIFLSRYFWPRASNMKQIEARKKGLVSSKMSTPFSVYPALRATS